MMPIMPKIKAVGKDSIISSPPRTASGLPQPGLKIIVQTIVRPAIARNVADIFP